MGNTTRIGGTLATEQINNDAKKHKNIYYTFLVLTIAGAVNTGMAGVMKTEMGPLGLVVYSVTGIAILATILEIVGSFWFIWLIFALIERNKMKKLLLK